MPDIGTVQFYEQGAWERYKTRIKLYPFTFDCEVVIWALMPSDFKKVKKFCEHYKPAGVVFTYRRPGIFEWMAWRFRSLLARWERKLDNLMGIRRKAQ